MLHSAAASAASISSNPAWQRLFQLIVGIDDLTVSETPDQIQLRVPAAQAENVSQLLTEALRSPAAFEQKLPVRINRTPGVSPSADSKIEAEVFPEETVEFGRDIFQSFFGPSTFSLAGMDAKAIFDGTAEVKDGVLLSKTANVQIIVTLWRSLVEALNQQIAQTPELARLRMAWNNSSEHLPSLDADLDTKHTKLFANALLIQCLGIVENRTNNTARLYFNFERLFQFLFPPKFTATDTEDGYHTFQFNKQHLMAAFQFMTHGGIFFRPLESDDATYVQPIIVSQAPSVELPLFINLIIDTSASMEASMPAVKARVKEFIAAVPKIEGSIVRITTFDSDSTTTDEFALNTIDAINTHIDAISLGSLTPLYSTTAAELRNLVTRSQDFNCTAVLLTDGVETEGGSIDSVSQAIQALRLSGNELPKMFTMGLGSGINPPVLRELAEAMGMTNGFIQLKTADDFRTILLQMQTIQSQREMVRFITQLHGDAATFDLPRCLSDGVEEANIFVPLDDDKGVKVETAGESYRVELAADAPVAKATSKEAAQIREQQQRAPRGGSLFSRGRGAAAGRTAATHSAGHPGAGATEALPLRRL